MEPNFQHVYSLLPTLLHFHHPILSGYLEGIVPPGICFSPNDTQRAWLEDIGRQADAAVVVSDNDAQLITGVYYMGSTSFISHNANSDLDIWVCHQSCLDNEERTQLQRKCHLLEQWANRRGVEVNFFLIDENRFRYSESGRFGSEDCGSLPSIFCCWMNSIVLLCAWAVTVFCGI